MIVQKASTQEKESTQTSGQTVVQHRRPASINRRQGEPEMNKTDLIVSAAGLREVSPQTATAFDSAAETCAAALTAALHQQPDLDSVIGPGNQDVMATNHHNHFKYMASTTALFDPASFVETVLWVVRTYRARGFSLAYWHVMLPLATDIVRTTLPPRHFEEIAPFYRWLAGHVDLIARLGETENSVYETLGGLHDDHC